MEAIKETIQNVIKDLVEKKAQAGASPEELLKKVLTKRECEHIKFNNFKKGVMSVNVDSSSWLYSLNLKKEALAVKLKKESSAIKSIRFRIGDIK